MALRKRHEELQKLYDEGKNVSSYSKLTTINNCLCEAYLTYIKRLQQNQNVYGVAGGKIHDALESIMNNKSKEETLIKILNEELKDYEMLGLNFPKDRNGNDTIRESWIKNMTHFCTNFVKPNGKFVAEQFLILKIDDDNYIQGYCDLIEIVDEEKKICNVYDWKTSSQFTKENLVEHARQLIIYGLALEQKGWTVNNIAWYMLKYCTITFVGKKRINSTKEEEITIVCERRNMVKDLQKHIIYKLQNKGYSEDLIEKLVAELIETNDMNRVNELLDDCFVVSDYIRYYDFNEETKEECLNFINNTLKLWSSLSGNEKDYTHRSFYKTSKTGKLSEDTFFCSYLCGHSSHCSHYQKFLATKESLNNSLDDIDLFS